MRFVGSVQQFNVFYLILNTGEENMIKNRLLYKIAPGSYVNDYDGTVDPSVLNEHATAAFRYFHSQIEGRLE
jgi:peroxidase